MKQGVDNKRKRKWAPALLHFWWCRHRHSWTLCIVPTKVHFQLQGLPPVSQWQGEGPGRWGFGLPCLDVSNGGWPNLLRIPFDASHVPWKKAAKRQVDEMDVTSLDGMIDPVNYSGIEDCLRIVSVCCMRIFYGCRHGFDMSWWGVFPRAFLVASERFDADHKTTIMIHTHLQSASECQLLRCCRSSSIPPYQTLLILSISQLSNYSHNFQIFHATFKSFAEHSYSNPYWIQIQLSHAEVHNIWY